MAQASIFRRSEIASFLQYVAGLRSFLGESTTPQQRRQRLLDQLRTRQRGETFLRIVEQGIFTRPASPYRRLFAHARVGLQDLTAWVHDHGVEAAVERAYDAGVYVSFEEFKCRRPIERAGLHFSPKPEDFDNPLLDAHLGLQTSGSRGSGTRVVVDFDRWSYETAHHELFTEAFALQGRPVALWYQAPPSMAGITHALRLAALRTPAERWFALNGWGVESGRQYALLTLTALAASRLAGRRCPAPEHTPSSDAVCVARWLAEKRRQGTRPVLHTSPSCAVRVCLAAQEDEIDIAGTFFRLGAEPYTPAKAAVVAAAGCAGACQYGASEMGIIGIPCGTPEHLTDVHFARDKLAVIQRRTTLDASGHRRGVLIYSTLQAHSSKLLFNVESDDVGILEERDCGCPLGEIGLKQHLREIHSDDKLKSEATTFLSNDLVELLETILPARFGGAATDYQFVEEEENAHSVVRLYVHPRLRAIDEKSLLDTALDVLASYTPVTRMMVERWREAGTLRVVRREPFVIGAGKILPLHVRRPSIPARS